jgi:hypothetical protein
MAENLEAKPIDWQAIDYSDIATELGLGEGATAGSDDAGAGNTSATRPSSVVRMARCIAAGVST